MATMPEFLHSETIPAAAPLGPQPARDPFQLRALPFEDVYFRPKKMDNSKLIREADPRAGGACWKVIGAACVTLLFLGGVLAPSAVSYTHLDVYKRQSPTRSICRRSARLP